MKRGKVGGGQSEGERVMEQRNILTSQNLTGWGPLTSGLNHLEPGKEKRGSLMRSGGGGERTHTAINTQASDT